MINLDLKNKEWKEFEVGKIFKVDNMKPYHKNNLKEFSGNNSIPYLSRTTLNNSLDTFVKNNGYNLNKKNCIVFGAESADFFYQSFDFITGNKMYRLSGSYNRYIFLFLVRILKNSIKSCGFGYGKGLTGTRLKNRFMILPVDEKGNPDWGFMESYMKNTEKEILGNILKRYKNSLNQLQNIKEVDIKSQEWGEFEIGKFFNVNATKDGIDKNKLIQRKGDFPYITRTENNNGIDSFISEQNNHLLNNGNVITIGLDTQTVFYQNSKFYTGQNIQILKYENINKYNALFLMQNLKIQLKKFSWGGNGATLTRLRKTKLILPIDKNKNLDWDFMENFMKKLEKESLNKIQSYYNI